MRGMADMQVTMLSLVTADDLVPEDHPIREIKPIVDNALRELSPTFTKMYNQAHMALPGTRDIIHAAKKMLNA